MNRILFAFLMMLGFTACTDDFEAINTNPNSPVAVPSSYLVTQAQRALVDRVVGEGFAGVGTYGQHYIQHLSQTQYTDVTRYDDIRTSFYGFYNGGLVDLQRVIELNTDEATRDAISASGPNESQIALAKVMQSWAFMSMTDFWGDIPYSEALQGVANLNPKYDEQEQIYRGIVATLVEAGDMITSGAAGVDGDIIFGGDMQLVRKFANSLILRAGIRVSDASPSLGQEWTNLGISRGVLESNDDNIQLSYIGGGEAANNTFYTDFLTRTDYAISEPLVDFMTAQTDPRIPVYAQPTATSVAGGTEAYVGMVYGVTESVAGGIPVADISYPGSAFVGINSPAVMLTYSEVMFNRAEAAQRGWVSGDAEALYDAAIAASMNQHGITDATAIDAFVNQAGVDYVAADFEQLIGEQKWVALFFQGMEAWSEWRRLGFPALAPAPDAIQITTIPTRRGYPDNEFSLNNANYIDALMRQFNTDEDKLDQRVWWDVD
jgi:hypothetical protein